LVTESKDGYAAVSVHTRNMFSVAGPAGFGKDF